MFYGRSTRLKQAQARNGYPVLEVKGNHSDDIYLFSAACVQRMHLQEVLFYSLIIMSDYSSFTLLDLRYSCD